MDLAFPCEHLIINLEFRSDQSNDLLLRFLGNSTDRRQPTAVGIEGVFCSHN